MSHGASKRLTTFPTELIVNIYAWEGMLYDAQRKLTDVLKAILDGDDRPSMWLALDERRKQVVFYNQQYTKAILSLQIKQNRG